jgi:hypothetical protein
LRDAGSKGANNSIFACFVPDFYISLEVGLLVTHSSNVPQLASQNVQICYAASNYEF